jgi:putative transposase
MSLIPTSSPAPAPAAQVTWLDLDAAARLSGKSEGHLRRLCGDRWHGEGKARLLQEPGIKPRWQIRSDADASFTPGASPTTVGPSIDLRNYPDAAVKVAMQRKAILNRWQQAITGGIALGIDRDHATAGFLALLAREAQKTGGETISRATLYNWQAAFKSEGLIGLMDGRARRTIEAKQVTGEDPFLEEVKSLWLTQQEPGVAVCHKMAMIRASKMGWRVHSYRSAHRYIENFANAHPEIVIQMRGGSEEFNNQFARHIERDYSPLQSNEIWNADHHQFDVLVVTGYKTDSSTGEHKPVFGRPWLTAWQDLRSRKIVGHVVRAADPNTSAILEALRLGCMSHGVPFKSYTDNGKDFDSYAFTGETKAQRRKRRRVHVEHDQGRLTGIYAALNIEHIHAWPYHGQSKPIERFFRTVEERFGKTFDTYCGNNPQNKPEQLPSMLARDKAPTLEEFSEKFATWLEVDYHQRVHTGDAMDCTPSHAWEANLRTKRTAQPEILELLLQRRYGPLSVGQCGITHKSIWYGQYELANWFGQQVFITFEGKGVSKVNVWSEDGRFLCVAKANLRVSANATSEILDGVIAEQRRENKVYREAARLRPRLHMDRTDRLNEAAALAAQAQAAPPIDMPPASISLIRSDIEGQLPAIREKQEMPLKKAVGDDTPAPRFQYSSRSQEDDSDAGTAAGFIYHGRSDQEDLSNDR